MLEVEVICENCEAEPQDLEKLEGWRETEFGWECPGCAKLGVEAEVTGGAGSALVLEHVMVDILFPDAPAELKVQGLMDIKGHASVLDVYVDEAAEKAKRKKELRRLAQQRRRATLKEAMGVVLKKL